MRECREPTEDLYENVHSARNQPIRPGKLAALGAAVTPGESTEQSLYSANPFQRGAGACEWFVRKPASIYSDESCQWRTREQADSKTAKTGDSVVVKTKTPVKTPDGTEIPKGSKLVGHVIAVQPSEPGKNSQVALAFDRVELKGGKTMPIHSQIQSISPAAGAASSAGPSVQNGGATNGSQAGGSTNPGASGTPNGASSPAQAQGGFPGAASATNDGPEPGTVVARTGQIAIRTTSIPGVLVANNEPGQQDPRMADASSILVGSSNDIDLDGGTVLVIAVAPTDSGTQ